MQISIPQDIHEAGKLAASTVGQSFSNFAAMAIAQRARNWRDPISGEFVVRDAAEAGELKSPVKEDLSRMRCSHPACAGPARGCERPDLHRGEHWFDVVEAERERLESFIKHYAGAGEEEKVRELREELRALEEEWGEGEDV